MAFIDKSSASLGDAILSGSLTPTTSTAFTTTQNELWTGAVIAVASQVTALGIRVYATSLEAQQLYGLPGQPGDFVYFNQDWVTTQTNTAAALMAQINTSEYQVNSSLQTATAILLKDLVTGASTGSGAFTVTADVPYVVIEFSSLARCTITKTRPGYNMATDPRTPILMGTTVGGDINYLETGVAVTTTTGILVVDENPFDIVGKANITNARIIEVNGADPATVRYEIYVG